MIVCQCTACGQRLKVKDTLAGKRVRCPVCAHLVAVPTGEAAAVSTEAWAGQDDRYTRGAPAEKGAGDPETVRLDFPKAIGRFRVVDILGAGGFGRVYKAYDPQLDREVAVKVPLRGTLEGREEVERFLREARAAATLRHPNICPVYEAGQDGDCHYLVMAYVHGKSLAEHLKERGEPVPARQAALVVRKLARALAVAHAQGIVHRDLKPGNVLVDRDRNDVVVTDFGLARRFHAEDAERTQEGAVLGTPAYMAPEQASGQRDAIGPACDIYSLGVILYEMLARRRPFTGSKREILDQVVRSDPAPPSRYRPGIDPRLEAICLKAIARDCGDRYQSMTEFAAALNGYLKATRADELPPAPAAGAAADSVGFTAMLVALSAELQKETQQAVDEAVGRHARKTTRLVLAGLAFVGVLTAAGVAVVLLRPTKVVQVVLEAKIDARLLQDSTAAFFLDGAPLPSADLRRPVALGIGEHTLVARRGDVEVQRYTFLVGPGADSKDMVVEVTDKTPYLPPPLSREQLQLYFANIRLAEQDWHEAEIWQMKGRLSGLKLATPEEEDPRGFEWYYLNRLATSRQITCDAPQAVHRVMFSPDSRLVAVMGGAWDVTGRNAFSFPGCPLGFSVDGGRLWTWDGKVLKTWNAQTGKEINARAIPDAGYPPSHGRLPVLSPGGNRLAGFDGKDKTAIKVWDTETWAVVGVIEWQDEFNPPYNVRFSPDGQQLAAAGPRGLVRVWGVDAGKLVTTFAKHGRDTLWDLAFSPDGKRLASSDGYYDAQGRIVPTRLFAVWEVATGEVLHSITVPGGSIVASLAFAPDGAKLAGGCGDHVVRLWDVPTGRLLRELKGHHSLVGSVDASPDGKFLASGAWDGHLKIWPLDAPQGPLVLRGHPAEVISVAFRPDGQQLASLGEDGSMAAWQARTGSQQWSFAATGAARIGYSPDGSLAIAWDRDGKAISACDALSGKAAPVPDEFKEWLEQSRDGRLRLMDGKANAPLKVWDVARQEVKLEVPAGVHALAFSPDGTRLADARGDQSLEVWDVSAGKRLLSWPHYQNLRVQALAYSPDGKRLFSGSINGTVKIWEPNTGTEALTLKGHTHFINCLAVSPNGKVLASGSADRTIRVWDADPEP